MKKNHPGYKPVALLLSMAALAGGLLSACKPAGEGAPSSVPASGVANSYFNPNYEKDLTEKVQKGMDGISLQVLYQTTGSWDDAILGADTSQNLSLGGDAKRAFVRIKGVTEDVYENVMFTLEVERKDKAPAYAALTPLNLGGALPTFVFSYAAETELADYMIQVTGENHFKDQVRRLEIPTPEGDTVISEGMAFPGDMVKINEQVYYYSGPGRTMYEIDSIDKEGVDGFALTAGASLISAEKLYATPEEWAKEKRIFNPALVTMVDPETKTAVEWPTGENYTVSAEIFLPQEQYQTTMNDQTVLATVEWSHAASPNGTDDTMEEMMVAAVDKFLTMAFEYKQGNSSLYLMSSASYFTLTK